MSGLFLKHHIFDSLFGFCELFFCMNKIDKNKIILGIFFKKMYITKQVYCETPIPKAQHSGIGKLNNPAKWRV